MRNNLDTTKIGDEMYSMAENIFPHNRSITGPGTRKTLHTIKEFLPNLEIYEIPTGTKVFDWKIPKEWIVRDAYIITPDGKKICDFKRNNLCLVGYSHPINERLSLSKLKKRIHTLKEQPDAIPYVTSYYKKYWGFCMSHRDFENLNEGTYTVHIDSELISGSMSYGELIIKGKTEDEILLSTYICHPSMANNEVSGPVVTTFLAKWISSLSDNSFTYRIIFIPETIGSIAYLSKNLKLLKQKVVAGFVITCVGDDMSYSFLPSRNGKTLSDSIAKHVLSHLDPNYKLYDWSSRGSDERQFCAPHINLPIASIMRTKYGEYDQYHTSLDDLNFISSNGLFGGFNALQKSLEAIEMNCYPIVSTLGEPHMSKYNLYPHLSTKEINPKIDLMMNLLTWADGSNSLLEIANKCNIPIWNFYDVLGILKSKGLVTVHSKPLG